MNGFSHPIVGTPNDTMIICGLENKYKGKSSNDARAKNGATLLLPRFRWTTPTKSLDFGVTEVNLLRPRNLVFSVIASERKRRAAIQLIQLWPPPPRSRCMYMSCRPTLMGLTRYLSNKYRCTYRKRVMLLPLKTHHTGTFHLDYVPIYRSDHCNRKMLV